MLLLIPETRYHENRRVWVPKDRYSSELGIYYKSKSLKRRNEGDFCGRRWFGDKDL